MFPPIRLGVNIDHVATIRNARGGSSPDPLRAAVAAIEAGADGITAHLREDRRHIRDEDVFRIRESVAKPLNFEMAVTDEMLEIALRLRPNACCLVPEKREERTTEGGLDLHFGQKQLEFFILRLKEAGIRVSLFIEPDPKVIELARKLNADIVELHTGTWCEAVAFGKDASQHDHEFQRLISGARLATEFGLEAHAGHGLDFGTAEKLAVSNDFTEFNIGHFLIGEAVFVGLGESVRRMKSAIAKGRASS